MPSVFVTVSVSLTIFFVSFSSSSFISLHKLNQSKKTKKSKTTERHTVKVMCSVVEIVTGSCEGTFRSSSRAATLVICRVLDEFTASLG